MQRKRSSPGEAGGRRPDGLLVNVIYSARYDLDLGSHVFPASKYRLVHDRLLRSGTITPPDVIEPEPASWSHLGLVHTPEYLAKMRDGTLTPDERDQLQLPWSRTLVDAFRTMVGGTSQAALIACGRALCRRRRG